MRAALYLSLGAEWDASGLVLKEWIEAGPDPAVDGVVRWRCADLVAKIAAEFDVV